VGFELDLKLWQELDRVRQQPLEQPQSSVPQKVALLHLNFA